MVENIVSVSCTVLKSLRTLLAATSNRTLDSVAHHRRETESCAAWELAGCHHHQAGSIQHTLIARVLCTYSAQHLWAVLRQQGSAPHVEVAVRAHNPSLASQRSCINQPGRTCKPDTSRTSTASHAHVEVPVLFPAAATAPPFPALGLSVNAA